VKRSHFVLWSAFFTANSQEGERLLSFHKRHAAPLMTALFGAEKFKRNRQLAQLMRHFVLRHYSRYFY
jgi:hypothetical protein